MLGMSEGSQQEREKEILEANDTKLIEGELTIGAQYRTARDAGIATAPKAEETLIANEVLAQVKRLEELSGEKYTHFGVNAAGFPTRDKVTQDYSALSEQIQDLKKQGHDIKDLDEIREGIHQFRVESLKKQAYISKLSENDNKYKALAANVFGAVAGYLSTPEGLLITAGSGGAGGGAALAAKTPLRAIGRLSGIEGATGGYIAGEEVITQAEIMGKEVDSDEVRHARIAGGAVTAALVAGVGLTPQVGKAAVSGFSKVNGFITDSGAREGLLKMIKGVDKVEAEKGAIPPEVKARRDELADIHDVYATKPETIPAEEHVARLDAQVEELKAEELVVPTQNEDLEILYKKNLDTFEPEDLQNMAEVDDILSTDPEFSQKLFEDLGEEVDTIDAYKQGREELSQLEQVITCMTGGAN